MRLSILLLAALTLPACDALESALGDGGLGEIDPQPPTALYRGLTLMDRPTNDQLGAWFCLELIPDPVIFSKQDGCEAVGFDLAPAKEDLKFSFDVVFDLGNPNTFPVPMVELLLALEVFQGADQAELGAVCVSFCDPEAGTCPEQGEEACRPADQEIRSLEDFVPTTDQLIEIARKAITGELFEDENLQFRYIDGRGETACGAEEPPQDRNCEATTNDAGESCWVCDGELEAHIRFDLGIDATLEVLGVVAEDSVTELLQGNEPSFDIPYSALGTVFFDVPVLGRFGIEFGPVEGTFSLD